MKFAQFKPGMQIDCGARSVSEEEIVEFARRYDPQWFHTDVSRASAGRWNGVIGSGWMTCCVAMELVVRAVLEGSEAFGAPGIDELRWENPVRPGDTLRVVATVLDARVSSSRRTGILRWRWDVYSQHDQRVLHLMAVSLYDLTGVRTEQ
jgi:acyl dehydratase